MVNISYAELKKAIDKLGQDGAGRNINIYDDGSKIILTVMDNNGHEINICLHDVDYPMKPTVTTKSSL